MLIVTVWVNFCGNICSAGLCTEGSVTVVSDAYNSNLQLVEMCSSEGVWSPVCDYNWTLQDATVVCRQLGYNGQLYIHAHKSLLCKCTADNVNVIHTMLEERGGVSTSYIECSGGESTLYSCSTSTHEQLEIMCQYVAVQCVDPMTYEDSHEGDDVDEMTPEDNNEMTPEDNSNNEMTPEDNTSNETIPEDIRSNETNSEEDNNNEMTPEDISSNETIPEDIGSNETTPEGISGNETEGISNNETTPEDISSNETTPEDISGNNNETSSNSDIGDTGDGSVSSDASDDINGDSGDSGDSDSGDGDIGDSDSSDGDSGGGTSRDDDDDSGDNRDSDGRDDTDDKSGSSGSINATESNNPDITPSSDDKKLSIVIFSVAAVAVVVVLGFLALTVILLVYVKRKKKRLGTVKTEDGPPSLHQNGVVHVGGKGEKHLDNPTYNTSLEYPAEAVEQITEHNVVNPLYNMKTEQTHEQPDGVAHSYAILECPSYAIPHAPITPTPTDSRSEAVTPENPELHDYDYADTPANYMVPSIISQT